jgi:AAA domain
MNDRLIPLDEALAAQPREAAPPPDGPDDYEPPPRDERKEAPSRFVLTRFVDFKPLDGDDYCVKGVLPRSGLAVFWGPPKCGKSFLVFDLLMHVALGWEYRGHRVTQGPVVYVCLEGGRAFRKRREAFRLAKLKEGDDPPFFFVVNPLSLAADRRKLIADIKRQVGEDIPAVVCIDTLNRSLAGSESSDEDMAAYIKAADAVRDAFDCLVVIVHHCGHEAQRPRGHSSLMGALDVQIAVSRDAEDNVVAELELAKDGETGLVFVSRLENMEIGRDRDGDPIASCVVREVNSNASTAAKKPGSKSKRTDEAAKLKRAIADAYERLADVVEKVPGFGDQPVKKVSIEAIRDEVKSRGFLEIKDTGGLTGASRMLFLRAKTDLIASGRYIESHGLFWKLAPSEKEMPNG